VFKRQKVVRDPGLRRIGGKQESGMARIRDVKKEDAVLPTQQAEQASASQDVLVR
jgi:hypothetical protein